MDTHTIMLLCSRKRETDILMYYKVLVFEDWNQGEGAKKRTYVTSVINKKMKPVLSGVFFVSSQSREGEGSFQVETKAKSIKSTCSVISKRMLASIPSPAHSLPFHISEEASTPQSPYLWAINLTKASLCHSLQILRALPKPLPFTTSCFF